LKRLEAFVVVDFDAVIDFDVADLEAVADLDAVVRLLEASFKGGALDPRLFRDGGEGTMVDESPLPMRITNDDHQRTEVCSKKRNKFDKMEVDYESHPLKL
jgi:hypothetical protein